MPIQHQNIPTFILKFLLSISLKPSSDSCLFSGEAIFATFFYTRMFCFNQFSCVSYRCPILRESCIQNELEIIQSEHEKNRFNDVWRTNQVERFTANTSHVFSRFSTGTRQTLTVAKGAERSLRYELFQFFKNNYSANIMCLSLVHNQVNIVEENQ